MLRHQQMIHGQSSLKKHGPSFDVCRSRTGTSTNLVKTCNLSQKKAPPAEEQAGPLAFSVFGRRYGDSRDYDAGATSFFFASSLVGTLIGLAVVRN